MSSNTKQKQNFKLNRWSVAFEAWPYFGYAIVIATFFYLWGYMVISALCGVISILILLFFRIPPICLNYDPNVIIAPAYGKIVFIGDVLNVPEKQRISIFMSVLDVHMNYAPIDGEVLSINHQKGSFMNAIKNEASESNEQVQMKLQYSAGDIEIKQIAGLIARRIVNYTTVGDSIKQGIPFGLIKFGSRVDIILPKTIQLKIELGQKVIGGKTILGMIK